MISGPVGFSSKDQQMWLDLVRYIENLIKNFKLFD